MFNLFKRCKKAKKRREDMDKHTVKAGEIYYDKRAQANVRIVGLTKGKIYATLLSYDTANRELFADTTEPHQTETKIPVVEYTPEMFFNECVKVEQQ